MSDAARAKPPYGPSPAERAALLRKYRLLAAWRRIRDAPADPLPDGREPSGEEPVPQRRRRQCDGGTSGAHGPPDRQALRELAQEFPGALRELDVLGLPELSRRIAYLEHPERQRPKKDALPGAVDERWPVFILAYHDLMRTALIIKRTSAKAPRPSGAQIARLLLAASKQSTLPIDASFARDVIHPPSGRLTIVVLAALARHFKVSAVEISRTLFPPRRTTAPPRS